MKNTLFFIVMAAGIFSAFTKPADGKTLFEKNCAKCHGANGTKGFFGAANLQKSLMTEEAIIERINNGKKFMPSFKKRLTPEDIQALAVYVKSLRTH